MANLLLQGSALYSLNAFMQPLGEAYGWSRSDINFSLGLASFIGQVSMPCAAAIAERHSLRMLMVLGSLGGGLSTIAMGLATNLQIFTFCVAILWISSQFCGGVVANALMSNWFIKYRGLAMGLSSSGTNWGGFLLPALCLCGVVHIGLCSTYIVLGLFICCLSPFCWLIIRPTPEDIGLLPDGLKSREMQNLPASQAPSWEFLFRQPAIWRIGLAFGLALMAAAGVSSQLTPRFNDMGLNDITAMLVTTIAATCSLGGKYFWGYICDKLSPFMAAPLLMISCLVSMCLCWLPPSLPAAIIFSFSFSASVGGLGVAMPNITACYFGAGNFLNAYKAISIFIIIRCLGFPIMGLSYKLASSYFIADIIFCVSFFVAAILMLGFSRKPLPTLQPSDSH